MGMHTSNNDFLLKVCFLQPVNSLFQFREGTLVGQISSVYNNISLRQPKCSTRAGIVSIRDANKSGSACYWLRVGHDGNGRDGKLVYIEEGLTYVLRWVPKLW